MTKPIRVSCWVRIRLLAENKFFNVSIKPSNSTVLFLDSVNGTANISLFSASTGPAYVECKHFAAALMFNNFNFMVGKRSAFRSSTNFSMNSFLCADRIFRPLEMIKWSSECHPWQRDSWIIQRYIYERTHFSTDSKCRVSAKSNSTSAHTWVSHSDDFGKSTSRRFATNCDLNSSDLLVG